MSSPAPNVARAGGIMMLSLLLSRVLGLVREAVMAGKFGADAYTDAYTVAFQIPDLIFFALAGGALSSAFIPVFSEYFHTEREGEAWKVFSVVTTFVSLCLAALILLAWVYAEPLTRLMAPGEPETSVPLIAHMSRILLPAQLAFFVGGLMFGTLYARQVFSIPGLGPNVYNVGIILGAVVIASFVSPGVVGMAWGALFGALIANFIIPVLAMRKLKSQFAPSLDLKHPGVKKVFKLMLPVVLGLSLPGVYGLILQWFGTFYADGVNTSLKYANQLMLAPVGVFGQSLAIGAFPALSQFHAQGRTDLFKETLARTMRTVIYITLPVTAIMLALSPEIVQALFQHGKFDSGDAAVVADMLSLFGVGIFAWCLHPVLMRAFFALHNSVLPVVIGTATTLVFGGLVAGLRQSSLGYAALPLASSISAVLLVVALVAALRAQIGGFGLAETSRTFGKAAFASAIVGAVLYLPMYFLRAGGLELGKLGVIAAVGLAVLLGGWLYYFLSRWLDMPERSYIERAMKRLDRRGTSPPVDSDPPG